MVALESARLGISRPRFFIFIFLAASAGRRQRFIADDAVHWMSLLMVPGFSFVSRYRREQRSTLPFVPHSLSHISFCLLLVAVLNAAIIIILSGLSFNYLDSP